VHNCPGCQSGINGLAITDRPKGQAGTDEMDISA
jgi:hypothetical protein